MSRPLRELRGTVQVAATTVPLSVTSTGIVPGPTTPLKIKDTIEGILGGVIINNVPLLTTVQIEQLVSLNLLKGVPLISLENRPFLYEIIALIQELGFNATYNYIASQNSVSINDLIFNSPLLTRAHDKVLIDADSIRIKVDAVESVFTCKRCGSKRTIQAERQVRSADEPMTIFVTCVDCGNSWKQ